MEGDTLTISLPRNISTALVERARRSGRDAAEYVENLVARDVARPSLEELLAPFHQQVEESEITEDEFDELVEGIREDIWQEQLAEQREQTR